MLKPIALATAVSLIATVLGVLPASAQGLGGQWAFAQSALNACGGDVAQHCPGVTPGGGRLAECLMAQPPARLSPACRGFMERTTGVRKAFFACSADSSRLCGGIELGGGRLVACLSAKRDLITRDCASALDEAGAALQR